MQSGVHSGAAVGAAPAARAQEAAKAPDENFDVGRLFAGTCGWCHMDGGRQDGKGPRLMGTTLSDAELISRIRNGKVGQMPAFAGAFTEPQLQAIVAYIRNLKPKNPADNAK